MLCQGEGARVESFRWVEIKLCIRAAFNIVIIVDILRGTQEYEIDVGHRAVGTWHRAHVRNLPDPRCVTRVFLSYALVVVHCSNTKTSNFNFQNFESNFKNAKIQNPELQSTKTEES